MFYKDVNTRIQHKGYVYSQALWVHQQKQFSAGKAKDSN